MLEVFRANTRLVSIEMRRYLPNTISMVVTFYAVFLVFFLGITVVGSPETAAADTKYLIVSVVLWFLALVAMQSIGFVITTEATRGTLEQLYMSPVPTRWILLARMTGTILVHLVVIATMLGLAMLTARQALAFDIATLTPLLALTITGMIGVGFMVASLALLFKQVQSLLQVGQFLLMALVAVPISQSPLLELAPAVRGTSMLRDAMTLGASWADFGLLAWVLLAINSAAFLALGLLVYAWAERRALRLGLLGQY
ncbi:MAG: ABC transporter permease [Trueperaceae bacterium]|nr:ABC transporter permease [Trueperaceae bacterium]